MSNPESLNSTSVFYPYSLVNSMINGCQNPRILRTMKTAGAQVSNGVSCVSSSRVEHLLPCQASKPPRAVNAGQNLPSYRIIIMNLVWNLNLFYFFTFSSRALPRVPWDSSQNNMPDTSNLGHILWYPPVRNRWSHSCQEGSKTWECGGWGRRGGWTGRCECRHETSTPGLWERGKGCQRKA